MIDLEKLAPILELLQKHGVSQIKMDGLELSFAEARAPSLPATPIDAPTEAAEPISHTNEELTNVMKLSDSELVDMLFPDSIAPSEAEQSQ